VCNTRKDGHTGGIIGHIAPRGKKHVAQTQSRLPVISFIGSAEVRIRRKVAGLPPATRNAIDRPAKSQFKNLLSWQLKQRTCPA